MPVRFGCVVEGHGDRDAVPVLIRRIAEAEVLPPVRIPKSKLMKEGELEKAIELVARKIGGKGACLVLLDADDDCPASLGPQLLERAKKVREGLPLSVVLAKREFESWFLAGAESLRGKRGLPVNLEHPTDAEVVRGAKEWLSQKMEAGRRYSETLDQPALAALLDLDLARRAASFDKCLREIERLWLAARLMF